MERGDVCQVGNRSESVFYRQMLPSCLTFLLGTKKKCVCAFQENTVFIDTKKLGIIKKKVRKLEDQLDHESRRLEVKLIFAIGFFAFLCVTFISLNWTGCGETWRWTWSWKTSTPRPMPNIGSRRSRELKPERGRRRSSSGRRGWDRQAFAKCHFRRCYGFPVEVRSMLANCCNADCLLCVPAAFPRGRGMLGLRRASIKAVGLTEALRRLLKLPPTRNIHMHKGMHKRESS